MISEIFVRDHCTRGLMAFARRGSADPAGLRDCEVCRFYLKHRRECLIGQRRAVGAVSGEANGQRTGTSVPAWPGSGYPRSAGGNPARRAPHQREAPARGSPAGSSLALRVMSAGIGIIWSRSVRSLIFVIQVDRDGEPALSGPIGCVIAMMREVAAGFPAVAGREVPT